MDIKDKIHTGQNTTLNLNKHNSFNDTFSKTLDRAKKQNEIDKNIQNFKDMLHKNGAYGYMSNMHEDKIRQKLSHKKFEFEKSLAINDEIYDKDKKQRLSSLMNKFLYQYEKSLQHSSNLVSQKQNNLQKVGTFFDIAKLIKSV